MNQIKPVAIEWQQVSETTLLVEFQAPLSIELSHLIGHVAKMLLKRHSKVLMNVTPSHQTLSLDYLPYRVDARVLIADLQRLVANAQLAHLNTKLLTLPIYYHPSVGYDIEAYEQKGLSLNQVIELHTQESYYVSALGFAPGFAFLAGLNPELSMPRLSAPRTQVAAGSVGIADEFTAVYPSTSPGGWRIIGNCPQPLYLPKQEPITPFSVGATVRFKSINQRQFLDLGGQLPNLGASA
ncbi:5-oxoprolinase subunit B family protein [Vibrio sp. WXL103]|uniref:5-oxoprolinase subunit B family protein n=1 Tax=unclassified Vibrio TaxID=2614977 RepID=UPI003EC62C25